MKDILLSLEGLSESITGAAISNKATFPFVRVPMFEVQAEHTRQASGVEFISFAPLVAENQRKDWEDFSWKEQGWLAESRAVSLSGDETFQRSGYYEGNISRIIYEHDIPEPPYREVPAVETPFLPAWHVRLS